MATLETFTVKIEGLDGRISEGLLNQTFKKFGEVFNLKIMPLKEGLTTTVGYVNFTDRSDAEVAAVKMNKYRLNGCLLITSFQESSNPSRTDYRALTDCKYMKSSQGCVPKDGKPCPYRHRISSTGMTCSAWLQKCCSNKSCPDLHPHIEKTEVKQNSETDQFEEICKCSLCLERLYLPKMLQCQHNFCKECLEDLIKFKGDPKVAVIECPICRTEHMLPPGQLIRDLPENLILKQTLDALGTKSSLDGPICIDCQAVVTTYCGDHDAFLCDNCKNEHIMVKGCDVFHSVKYSRSKDCIAPYCQEHDCFQNYGCYEPRCGTPPVCVFCAEYKHPAHKIITFNELAHKFESPLKNELLDIEDSERKHEKLLQSVSMALKASKKEQKNMKKNLETWKIETLSKVLHFLQESEKHILATFHSVKNDTCIDLNAIKQQSSKALGNYKQAKEKVDQLFKRSNIEVFYQAENICKEMKEIHAENKPSEDIQFPDFKIEIQKGDKDGMLYAAIQSTFGDVLLSRDEEGDIQQIVFGQGDIDTSSVNVEVLAETKPEEMIVKALADMKIALPGAAVENNIEKKQKKKNKKKQTETESVVEDERPCYDFPDDVKNVEDEKSSEFFEIQSEEENYYAASEENYGWNEMDEDKNSEDSDTCSISSNSSNNPSGVSSKRQRHPRGRGKGRGRGRGRGESGRGRNRGRAQGKSTGPDDFANARSGKQDFRGGINNVTRCQMNSVSRAGMQNFRGGRNSGPQNLPLPSPFPFPVLPIHPSMPQSNAYTTLNSQNLVRPPKPTGSYQRPSPAKSFSSLRSLHDDGAPKVQHIICYRCGRPGHPVQNCKSKTTADGRPLI